MKEIGILEATTHLSEIAERVKETGQAVTLTKQGEPYVDLVPHQATRSRRSKAEIAAALAELQRELPKITTAENQAAITEGRR